MEEGLAGPLGDAKIMISAKKNAAAPRRAASGSFPLKSPQRVSRRNFTSFLAAIVGSTRSAACVRHYFKVRGVKAGFALLYDGIRHTLITHGRTIRYVYTRGAFLSLFLIRVPTPFSLSSRGSFAGLIVARSTIRSRENERRFIAAMGASPQPAGPSFSRQDADLKEKRGGETGWGLGRFSARR